jgi:predicted kinase
MKAHICSFQSADNVTRKTRYEDLKAQVLKAGRFSVFEATANDRAALLFSQLCRDPELETETLGFPWTAVRRKEAK